MQTGYAKQVFYSLANGEVATSDVNNWELAFAVSGNGAAGSAVLLNEANATLWSCPFDTSAWTSFDTTGYLTWKRLLNSDTTWTNGAFNAYRGAAGVYDMGWGVLNPSNNYWTFGDSLYLLKLSDNSFRKLAVVSLKTGTWEFKYADIDGSNETTVTFNKNAYPNRNFIYYSVSSNQLIDREPDYASWELTFVKHIDYVSPPGQFVSVSSVFSNTNCWTAKGNFNDFAEANSSMSPQTSFSKRIDNIGREWKYYSSATGWLVYDTIAYFIYNLDSTALYRIVFTDFGGSTDGISYFEQEELDILGLSVNEHQQPYLFPNPVAEELNINLGPAQSTLKYIEFTNAEGRIFCTLNPSSTEKINVSDWPSGLYFALIYLENGVNRLKFYKL